MVLLYVIAGQILPDVACVMAVKGAPAPDSTSALLNTNVLQPLYPVPTFWNNTPDTVIHLLLIPIFGKSIQ